MRVVSITHLQTTTESPTADCARGTSSIRTRRTSDGFKKTYVEGVEEDLCNVSRNRNVREVTVRTSRFVAIVNERINQSLCDRSR